MSSYLYTNDLKVFIGRDASSYIAPAKSMIENGTFSNDSRRTPGYPLLLIPGVAFNNLIPITILIQILLSCATIYFVYLVCKLIFENKKIGIWAAFLYAIEPVSILFASRIATETFFTFSIMAFLYIFLKYLKNNSTAYLIAASILLVISTLIRPISFFLPIYLTVIFFIITIVNSDKKKIIIHCILFIFISHALMGIWQIRNKMVDGFSGISNVSAFNLYYCNAASVKAKLENRGYYEVRDSMLKTCCEDFLALNPDKTECSKKDLYKFWAEEGSKIILQNPVLYAKIHIKGIIRLMMDPGATFYLTLFHKYPRIGGLLDTLENKGLFRSILFLAKEKPTVFWSNLFLGIYLLFFYFLAIFSLYSKKFWNNFSVLIIIYISLYFIILSGGPGGIHRFRHPIMPIICIISAYGLNIAKESIKTKRIKFMKKIQ